VQTLGNPAAHLVLDAGDLNLRERVALADVIVAGVAAFL
jgi:hypothetical protein